MSSFTIYGFSRTFDDSGSSDGTGLLVFPGESRRFGTGERLTSSKVRESRYIARILHRYFASSIPRGSPPPSSLSKRNEPGNHPGPRPLTDGLSTQPLTRSATPPSLRHSPC